MDGPGRDSLGRRLKVPFERRVAFICEHPELLEEKDRRRVVQALKDACLISYATNAGDVRVEQMVYVAKEFMLISEQLRSRLFWRKEEEL